MARGVARVDASPARSPAKPGGGPRCPSASKKISAHVTTGTGYLVLSRERAASTRETNMTTPRLQNNPFKLAPEGTKAMMALEASFKASGLEHSLMELVRMR